MTTGRYETVCKKNFILKYGLSQIKADIPSKKLGTILPNFLPEIKDIHAEIIKILNDPTGTPPLSEFAKKSRKTVIIVSDQTRLLPSAKILPVLYNELVNYGVDNNTITVVIGVGNHRPPTEDEKKKILGVLYPKVKCVHSKELDFSRIGTTEKGTQVEISTPVAEADLVIGIGNVEMHQLAGFSGGAKAIAVGVASKCAIEHNHSLIKTGKSESGVIEGNHVREDMEDFARIAGLKFIVNVVLNEHGGIMYASAGDPIKAHRKCARIARQVYSVNISNKAELVIVSAGGYPKDATVYQVQKTIQNALKAVSDNGIVIVAAKCNEGFGDSMFEKWIRESKSPEELIQRNSSGYVLGAHKSEYIAKAVKKASVFLVSDMKPEAVTKMYFKPFSCLQNAINEALEILGPNPQTYIIPWGGLTVPQFTES